MPAAITVLPRIADAVKGRVPIIFDSGIRRGQDVFRAIALGADVVACGRPVLYGLALGGHLGAQSVLEYLRDDLYIVMQLAGTPNVKAITRDYVAPPTHRLNVQSRRLAGRKLIRLALFAAILFALPPCGSRSGGRPRSVSVSQRRQ